MSNHDHEAQTQVKKDFYREKVSSDERKKLTEILNNFGYGITVDKNAYIGYTRKFPFYSEKLIVAIVSLVAGVIFTAIGSTDTSSGFFLAGSLLIGFGVLLGLVWWKTRKPYQKYNHIIVEINHQDYIFFYDGNGDFKGLYVLNHTLKDDHGIEYISLGEQINYNKQSGSFDFVKSSD